MEVKLVLEEIEERIVVVITSKQHIPLYIEATNRATLEVACFYTFSCSNEQILEEVQIYRNLVNQQDSIAILDVLEILGFI